MTVDETDTVRVRLALGEGSDPVVWEFSAEQDMKFDSVLPAGSPVRLEYRIHTLGVTEIHAIDMASGAEQTHGLEWIAVD